MAAPKMRLQSCRNPDCGARVLEAQVDGQALQLNPIRTAVAIPAEDGGLILVEGFQPHAFTCVDIAGRREFLSHLRAP